MNLLVLIYRRWASLWDPRLNFWSNKFKVTTCPDDFSLESVVAASLLAEPPLREFCCNGCNHLPKSPSFGRVWSKMKHRRVMFGQVTSRPRQSVQLMIFLYLNESGRCYISLIWQSKIRFLETNLTKEQWTLSQHFDTTKTYTIIRWHRSYYLSMREKAELLWKIG